MAKKTSTAFPEFKNEESAARYFAAYDAVLAALIGGDLGPRLLPMGSLAGLLWLESLRRQRVDLPLGRFVLVGAAVTAPVLALSLALI